MTVKRHIMTEIPSVAVLNGLSFENVSHDANRHLGR